jgi:hypothetical protein
MINFPYHLARTEGRITREIYRAALPLIAGRKIESPRRIDIDIFAYSGKAMLPEQVASIRSFLRYAGRPKSYNVVSDGTYTPRDIQWIEQIDPAWKSSRSFRRRRHQRKLRSYLLRIHGQTTRTRHVAPEWPGLICRFRRSLFPSASDLLISSPLHGTGVLFDGLCFRR